MLEGIDEFRQSLRVLADRVEAEAAPLAVKAGLDVLAAGVARRTPVDTGALVSAETETPVTDKRHYVSGKVAVTSDHAAAEEFGTTRQAAQPFFRPAIASDGPAAVDALADSLRSALDALGG